LGWIEHLLGNHQDAAKILAGAVKLDSSSAETHLHVAAVALALGDRSHAERALNEAVRLNPSLDQRDDTVKLRERLKS
jgi:Tfp pilus assembly protein PilF